MGNFTTEDKICITREITVNKSEGYDDIITNFDIKETCKWIERKKFAKVCLQFPDDLLEVSCKVYKEIKDRIEVDLYIMGDTSYASCCIDSVAAMHVQANGIVHYGHKCFSKTDIPVYMVLPKEKLDFDAAINTLKEKYDSDDNMKLCLFYGAEFEHCNENITRKWFQKYPKSYICHIELEDKPERFLGRIIKDVQNVEYPIQALKDCICIYLGSRGQTIFNYTISVPATKWYLLNPSSSQLEKLDETIWFKRRRFLIEKCKDANIIGILICKLSGKQTKDIISRMKELCKVNGKKSYIVSVGKPNSAKLANFPEIDIYVMIACPENDLYSSRDFYRPIVFPYELEIALNSNREPFPTYHVTDYDELLPGRRHYGDIKPIQEIADVSLITGRIREAKVNHLDGSSQELAEQQNWALESIGKTLQDRSWKGLEQKLGETEVKEVEEGRKGIALQYSNEQE